MAKKGLSVWIFSSMTFIALLHMIDAISALVFGNPIKILQIYPVLGDKLQGIAPTMYFWTSSIGVLILWAITCLIVFENPVETFLNKILSDAKTQGAVESQLLESKSEVLDVMLENVESSNQTLSQIKDLICNVRTEAKEIQPLRDAIENLKTEMSGLRREIKRIGEKAELPSVCLACGQPLMADYNMCPYCGEKTKVRRTPLISLRDYK